MRRGRRDRRDPVDASGIGAASRSRGADLLLEALRGHRGAAADAADAALGPRAGGAGSGVCGSEAPETPQREAEVEVETPQKREDHHFIID